jgi:hypothetical protein
MTNTPSNSSYKYAFALHRNARAFIESAVEYARHAARTEWKFAILHLTTAIELILKARLAMVDCRLLVGGVTEVTDRQIAEGAFRSIGIDECIDRLTETGKFALNARQRHTVKALQRLRNRIAHYIEPDDEAATRAVAAAGLNLFIDIVNTEFPDEDPHCARTMTQLVVDLHREAEFVEERMLSLGARLSSAVRPRTHYMDECTFCLQDAAVIEGEQVICLFCGQAAEVREVAESHSEDGTAEECPDCGRFSVLKGRRNKGVLTSECFICGWFRGPELTWSDGKVLIPRLHCDR